MLNVIWMEKTEYRDSESCSGQLLVKIFIYPAGCRNTISARLAINANAALALDAASEENPLIQKLALMDQAAGLILAREPGNLQLRRAKM